MLFQSFEFLIFLIFFIVFMMLCPKKFMLAYVTAASLFFYCWWYPPYIFLMIVMVVGAWALTNVVSRRPHLLTLVILVILCPLLFFKYTNFLLSTIGDLFGANLPSLEWALPLGISFVTFTIVSLVIDTVKLKRSPPGFFEISTYITFFPHLIAGPILRAGNTIPQFKGLRIDWSAFPSSLALFSIGILKKVMIADPIGLYVDQAYLNVHNLTTAEAALAIIGFSVQIYCDFSAYSDMAIALAAMFGVKFPENFRSPYAQTSLTSTWACWHITLTHWLRDYVLMPLYAKTRHLSRHLAIVVTMLVSGLWHGANWTFVLWGLCHGFIIWIESRTGYATFTSRQMGLLKWFFIAVNFIIWSFLSVLFRADSVATAMAMWSALLKLPDTWTMPNGHILSLCVLLLAVHKYDQAGWIMNSSKVINKSFLIPISLIIILGGSLLFYGRLQSFYYFDF
jgi:alginate O-acetyltransferase complex protein AlgI